MMILSLDHFQHKLVRKPKKSQKIWILSSLSPFTLNLATDDFAQQFSSPKFNHLLGLNFVEIISKN